MATLDDLEELNRDHHRRMRAAHGRNVELGYRSGMNPKDADRDLASKLALVEAMRCCSIRYGMHGSRVLELGASDGHEREFLLEALKCTKYEGIEIVPEVTGPGVRWMAVESLEEVERYSYVYSRHVMEHTIPPLSLPALRRSLKPDGIVGAVTPFFKDNEPAHITQLSLEEWIRAYTEHGFRVVYAVRGDYVVPESHIVAVRDDFPLGG